MATLHVPPAGYKPGSLIGAVGVNIRTIEGNHTLADIKPGETIEAELYDPENPVYAALVASGRLVIS